MNNFIWHNPRCSKSRQTLQLIEDAGVAIEIIDYQLSPPRPEELAAACAGLACWPLDVLRHKEALFSELGLSRDDARSDADWLQILSTHPKLIERPIVRINGHYALGRPPENIAKLL